MFNPESDDFRLKRFAQEHRLKIRLDECGDPIIPGRRGHLYFDGKLCLIVTDGTPASSARWKALGAEHLWLGDISLNRQGRRVQDVKAEGVPEAKAHLAIRLAGIKAKRVLSPAHLQALQAAGTKTQFQRPQASLGPEVVVDSHPAAPIDSSAGPDFFSC